MPKAPTAVYRDGLTIGQLAREWERSPDFVRGLIADGKLTTDERGRVTIKSLRDFYRFLHVPVRLTHGARRRRLRVPESWPWAAAIVAVFANIAAISQPA